MNVPQQTSYDYQNHNIGRLEAVSIAEELEVNTALVRLNLAENRVANEGAEAIAQALVANSSLIYLNLSKNQIEEVGCQALGQALAVNSGLTHLDLYGNKLGVEGAQAIEQALAFNKSLVLLNLAWTEIGDKEAEYIGVGLSHNSALSHLNLATNLINHAGAQAIGQALATNPVLSYIDFARNHIGNEGAQAILRALTTASALTHLNLAWNEIGVDGAKAVERALTYNSSLVYLDLHKNHIGHEGTQFIGLALANNSCLQHLNLSGNQVKNIGAQALMQGLVSNKSLTHLNLERNEIGDEGAQALGTGLEINSTLINLSLNRNQIGSKGAKAIGRALLRNVGLIQLNLSWNAIDDEGAQAIGWALDRNATLLQLDLCRVEAARAIGRGLSFNSTLVSLNIERSQIGDDEVKLIAQGLQRNSSLTYLNLALNQIGDEGAVSIGKALKSNFTLTQLNLERNKIGSDGALAIGQALAVNSTLTQLEMAWNEIGNAGARAIEGALLTNSSLLQLNLENNGIRNLQNIIRLILINSLCNQLNSSESDRNSIPRQLDKREDIEVFLRELIHAGEKWNAGKLIILGSGEVGKTTLLKAIRVSQEIMDNKNKSLFDKIIGVLSTKNPLQEPLSTDKRTVGIEQSTLYLKDGDISVWDFAGQLEYAITHQFFLSNESAVYLVCYDLSQPPSVQMQQLSYWLDFLQSALPPSSSSSSVPKWKVIIVGTKIDLCVSAPPSRDTAVPAWQTQWPRIPIHDTHYSTSARTLLGTDQLLLSIDEVFGSIFKHHTLKIPRTYKSLLKALQSIKEEHSMQSISTLYQAYHQQMTESQFATAIKYLHAIGRVVVLLGGDLVCTLPKLVPEIAANFFCTEEVRMKLVETDRIHLLEEDQIGIVLTIQDDKIKLTKEVKILEYIGVCFKLSNKEPVYLFPGLSVKTENIAFTVADSANLHLAAVRFKAPQGAVFIPGFFCQFIVAICERLNISKSELVQVHANCVSVTCSGLFVGELLVTIDDNARAIVVMIRAINPDLTFVNDVFTRLTRKHASQYEASCTPQVLCPTCIDLAYFQAKIPRNEVGVVEKPRLRDSIGIPKQNIALVCKPRLHTVEDFTTPHQLEEPMVLDPTLCWTHNRPHHEFFLNYRVATEGTKSSAVSSEGKRGLVEIIYQKLATTKQKNGKPIYVFWDKKCLVYGQDWENGFLHGIKSAKVIILLISQKVFTGITDNAPYSQDNVLIEYQNETHKTPVLPIFAAEMTDSGNFIEFNSKTAFAALPDKPHARKANAQSVIDELRGIPTCRKEQLIGSIKNTVDKIYNMNGIFLDKRGENPQDLDHLVAQAMEILEWASRATLSPIVGSVKNK